MSMTEKQGGSDVRAGTTRAEPRADGTYRLIGHKWFTSAPMNDLFLTLAQAPGGLTCFVLPRVLPDGSRNAIRLQRLKDKLGNRSNASAEIEYAGAIGWRLGDEGRGVATIIEMVSMTRLDCVLGSAALIRVALSRGGAPRGAPQRVRRPAGRQPADAGRAGRPGAGVRGGHRARAAAGRAPSTATSARCCGWPCRRRSTWCASGRPTVVAEALECLGGNGYVEESGLPRLYREAPLNSIWEGSGNVTALDVLRAITREPDSVEAVLAEMDAAAGRTPGSTAAVRELRAELRGREERRARRMAELLALCLQGSLLLRHAPDEVAPAFVASRFLPDGPWRTAGTLPRGRHRRPTATPRRRRGHPLAVVTQGPRSRHHSPSSASASSPNGLTPGPAASACATCTCRHLTRSGMPPALTSVPSGSIASRSAR